MTDTIHRLKITLHDVQPPVWRRIEVPSSMTLGELSSVLEAAMGWLGGHLHMFDVDGVTYGTPDPDWETDDLDEGRFRLGDVLPSEGRSMRWDYDFGDGWEHTVEVEVVTAGEPGAEYPRCVAGERACPPEDCGGPWGYANLLEALADSDHPDHVRLREWAPPGFDPSRFAVAETDAAMRSPRPLEGCSVVSPIGRSSRGPLRLLYSRALTIKVIPVSVMVR